jgi:hypothetical protein
LVEQGAIQQSNLDLFKIVNTAQEAWHYLCEYWQVKAK